MDITGLPAYYFSPDKLEAYDNANYLKGGIVYADRVTTVSRQLRGRDQDTVLRGEAGRTDAGKSKLPVRNCQWY